MTNYKPSKTLATILALLYSALLSADYIADCKSVYSFAKQHTSYSKTIAAIAYTESTCGRYLKGDDGKSLGVMHIQIPTLRYLTKKIKTLSYLNYISDKSLKILLTKNPKFNLLAGILYFNFLVKTYGYKEAIIRYNGYWEVTPKGKLKRDINGNKIKNVAYYNRVMRNMQLLKDSYD